MRHLACSHTDSFLGGSITINIVATVPRRELYESRLEDLLNDARDLAESECRVIIRGLADQFAESGDSTIGEGKSSVVVGDDARIDLTIELTVEAQIDAGVVTTAICRELMPRLVGKAADLVWGIRYNDAVDRTDYMEQRDRIIEERRARGAAVEEEVPA